MEKKYQEQARELVEELQQERESLNSQSSKLKQKLQNDMDAVRDEEAKLKFRLNLLEQVILFAFLKSNIDNSINSYNLYK